MYSQSPTNEKKLWYDYWCSRNYEDFHVRYLYEELEDIPQEVERLAYVTMTMDDDMHSAHSMKQLYNDYGPKGVQFLGVSFDTDIQSLIDYGVENEIAWLNVCNKIKWKENPISVAYDLHWIPSMFLVKPDGNLAAVCFHVSDLRAKLEEELAD